MTSKKEEAAALVAAAMDLDSLPRMSERRPRVAMNAVTDFTGELSKVERERDAALEKLALHVDALPTRRLDSATVKPSSFANRTGDSFESAEFEVFKQEIAAAGGNVQPIKVRRASAAGEWEIVFGHRRHRACAELGLPVLAMIQEEMDDLALFEEMSRENEARSDLSAYELAMHYKRGIDAKLYKNWAAVAAALGKSKPFMGRYSALAELPKVVIQAFPSPNSIQAKWAVSLQQVLEADKDAVLAAARDLKDKRLSAKEAFDALINRQPEKLTRVNFSFGVWSEGAKRVDISIDRSRLNDAQIKRLKELLTEFGAD